MSGHPLDRAVWGALTGRQAQLAIDGCIARRFVTDVSPFIAMADDSPAAQEAAAALIVAHGPAIFLQNAPVGLPRATQLLRSALGVQMIAGVVAPPGDTGDVVRLGPADWSEMAALAALTEPGPFLARTPVMGDFHGIRDGGRLVAMAGERLKPAGFTEVSAVCTHPDARGRGYASLLSRVVVAGICARGDTPFLHAFASNRSAIRLYEQLGFHLRAEVTMSLVGPA